VPKRKRGIPLDELVLAHWTGDDARASVLIGSSSPPAVKAQKSSAASKRSKSDAGRLCASGWPLIRRACRANSQQNNLVNV